MRFAFLAFAFLFLVSACTPGADTPPPVLRAAASPPTAPGNGTIPANQWRAVLIAGDSSTPAFDNGVEEMRAKLQAHGVTNITIYSADPASVPRDRLSSSGNVASALRGGGGQACLAFMTSHGNEDGFYLRPDRRLLTPGTLDRLLAEGCGSVPTVVVVSACHSGTFIDNGVRKPNRVILTAAATNRTSFGCGADDEYTYYDWCLLHQFDGATTWSELSAATRSCVEGLERKMGVKASLPQLFVGSEVANLRLPGR
jgi:Peptidase C13 family